MFKNAVAFNSVTIAVTATQTAATDVTSMFEGAAAFNEDISSWDVTRITTYTNMFKDASSFNRDIRIWAMPIATTGANLANMFVGASNFQQNLCDWNFHLAAAAGTVTPMFSSTKCPNPNGVFNAATTTNTVDILACCTCLTATVDTGYPNCA